MAYKVGQEKTHILRLILAAAILAFLAFAFLTLNYAIPPFQNPDEPMHFYAVMVDLRGEEKADEVEKEIIKFMDQHFWWKFLGLGRPSPLPSKLTEISFLTQNYPLQDIRQRLNNLVIYHKAMAGLIRVIFGPEVSQVRAYYFLRMISAFLSLLSLWIFYWSNQKIGSLLWKRTPLGDFLNNKNSFQFASYFFPVLIVAFLPQFLITSIAVSPDAFCIFLGSAFFAASYNLILGYRRFLNIFLIFLVSLIGFFTDRSLFFLIILVFFVFFLLINFQNLRKTLILSIASIFLLMTTLFILTHLFPLLIENSFLLMRNALQGGLQAIKDLFSFKPFARFFLLQLVDSFLVRFGWMSFRAEGFIYWSWRCLILIATLGVIIYSVRLFWKLRENLFQFKIWLFSSAAVIVQLIGIYAYYGRVGSMPQGRYLFPLILPLIFFFTLGLTVFFSTFMKKRALVALALFLILECLFFNYLLWAKIFPIFHLLMKSPYPGI